METGASLATVDLGSGDQRASVTIITMRNAAGLAFRVAGPRNFWALRSATGSATWNVVKVIDGVATTVRNTGLQPMEDGTTVAVEAVGSRIEVFVDGLSVSILRDDDLSGASAVGMIAATGEAEAEFDDFDSHAIPNG